MWVEGSKITVQGLGFRVYGIGLERERQKIRERESERASSDLHEQRGRAPFPHGLPRALTQFELKVAVKCLRATLNSVFCILSSHELQP